MTKQDITKLKESTVQKEKQLENEQLLISHIKIAYNSMNDELATYLIQKPQKIKPLLGNEKNSLLRCTTAMHALAISLFNTKCHDVLNRNMLATEQDEEKVTKLLSQATETNADVQQKKQNVNAINEKHNTAQKLLQDYNDAKKLFMDVQQEIKTFMKSTQNQHQ